MVDFRYMSKRIAQTLSVSKIKNCRLFSCGTSKYGESFVVEWSEDGVVERVYQGLGKYSSDVIQFDTSKNRFLVVGADFSIKCWDMDNVNLLTSIDADGDLTVSLH